MPPVPARSRALSEGHPAVLTAADDPLLAELWDNPADAAGLPQPTIVTGILRTIKASMLEVGFGRLGAADLTAVSAALQQVLDLS